MFALQSCLELCTTATTTPYSDTLYCKTSSGCNKRPHRFSFWLSWQACCVSFENRLQSQIDNNQLQTWEYCVFISWDKEINSSSVTFPYFVNLLRCVRVCLWFYWKYCLCNLILFCVVYFHNIVKNNKFVI